MDMRTIGFQAENLAREWLEARGYHFVQANYRYQHAEVDLIMTHSKTMVFFEIKFRTNLSYGYPETFVYRSKQRLIIRAADYFVHRVDWKHGIRFDIIAIEQLAGRPPLITHFQDAFY
ncbi:MAG: YraN family protein [Nitritalea sp.]